MLIEIIFEKYFKPEIQSSGKKLFTEGKVNLSSKSDTTIDAFVRASPAVKVNLMTKGINNILITGCCTCTAGKKNRFCKHLWAVLMTVEKDFSDYLEFKKEIVLNSNPPEQKSLSQQIHIEKNKLYKLTAQKKAADYKKEQYQKQKNKLKELKSKNSSLNIYSPSYYDNDIILALKYFNDNGFDMPQGPDKDILIKAKKELSRIFHPDKGGSHAESVELNNNYELLLKNIKN